MNYEIRAMSLGEILDMGFRLLRNHFALLTGIGLVVYLPLAALQLYIQPYVHPHVLAPMRPGAALAAAPMAGLLFWFLSMVVSAAITFAIGEVYLGRRASLGGALRTGLSLVFPVFWTTILSGIAIVLGLVLFIVPGVYLMFAFLLINQVIVFERKFGVKALTRSRELMRGNINRGAGVLFTAAILSGVLSFAAGLVLAAIPLVGPFGQAVVSAVSCAYVSAVAVVLYFDIRSRNEAFDLEHLAELVEARAPAMPAHAG